MENKIYLVLKVLVIAFILSFYTFGKDKNLMLQYNFKDINKDKVSDISLNNNDLFLKKYIESSKIFYINSTEAILNKLDLNIKDELIITYCEFTYGHQFPVEHTKSIY